jgi:hypothetical protein
MPFPGASALQQLITDAQIPGLSMAVVDRHATWRSAFAVLV